LLLGAITVEGDHKMVKHISVFLVLVLAACAPHKADLTAYYPPDGQTPAVSLFKNMEYDVHGKPVFSTVLQKRPSREGEQFVAVQYVGNKPVRSFDIVVAPESADMARPLKVIYEWTGKGFKAGVASGKSFADSLMNEQRKGAAGSSEQTGTEKAMAVGPVILLSVGGFVVGLAASIPATVQELAHVVVSAREKVISYSVYEYDGKQRLSGMKTYLPTDISHEIIKTEFFYQDDEATPSETQITSYPENTVRTIP
jgi:hypothetical protein